MTIHRPFGYFRVLKITKKGQAPCYRAELCSTETRRESFENREALSSYRKAGTIFALNIDGDLFFHDAWKDWVRDSQLTPTAAMQHWDGLVQQYRAEMEERGAAFELTSKPSCYIIDFDAKTIKPVLSF